MKSRALSLALQHSLEWFSLTGPAVLLAAGVSWFLRGWLLQSVWHYIGAWIGGLVVIGGCSTVVVWIYSIWLNSRLERCRVSSEYYHCTEHIHVIAYPVIVGLIAFGLYLVGMLVFGIVRIIHRKTTA